MRGVYSGVGEIQYIYTVYIGNYIYANIVACAASYK